MPTINHDTDRQAGEDAQVVTWTGMATGDTIESYTPIGTAGIAGAIQISGTFGGATVILQQSNDGSTWFTAKDVFGDDVSATANAIFEISLSALYIRPSISGGTGDAVNVILALRG